jgi:HAD superfamily hydrolase (TIGR01549 family)
MLGPPVPQKARKLRAVLLDLYGTLVEMRERREPYARLAQATGWAFDRRTVMCRRFTRDELASHAGCRDPRLMDEFDTGIRAELDGIAVYPDVRETLAALRAEGLRLALVSNLSEPYGAVVNERGLLQPFDAIVLSYEVGSVKPEPEIYREALARLGVEAGDAMMVGDSLLADVHGARAAGLSAVHLCRHGRFVDGQSIESLRELVDLVKGG